MKIAVIGTGYVGIVTGTCLANLGNTVICVDIDKEKIKKLNGGIMPIYEPGLRDLVEINAREKRLFFTTDIKEAVEKSDVIFIAVGTPSGKDGKADMTHIFSAAESIGKHMNGYKVIVDKSTVPPGTAHSLMEHIGEKDHKYDFVSNPEFLREGEAINDFMNPDRIVIGVEGEKAKKIMLQLYKGIERTGKPIFVTDIKSAELIKYASNAMLATRISFMNQLAPFCEKTGADIKQVAKGMGLDGRIGPRFLQAGIGYGGSCFPKDVKAVIGMLEEYGCGAALFRAVDAINEKQKGYVVQKVKKHLCNVKGKTVAVWGLAFKPKTDDMREAPSIVIINELQKLGAGINAFDPVAEENAKKILKDVKYMKTPLDAVKDADALVLVTEWDEFRNIDLNEVKALMKNPVVIDGRNIYDKEEMKKLGFVYEGVGR